MPTPAAYAVETFAVGWLSVGMPLAGRLRYRRLGATRPDRLTFYRRTVARQWTLTLVVLAVLLAGGVRPAQLGLVGHLAAAVSLWPALLELVVVALAVVVALRWQARRRPDRPLVERLLRPVRGLLPVTATERRAFAGVAVTAGITEEVLYRGVVTHWLLQTWPELGLDGAIVVSSVAFGLAHAYQGPVGVVLTGLAGYAFGVLYGATGSLLLPAVLHALVDLRVLLVLPKRVAPAPALTSHFVTPRGVGEGSPTPGQSTGEHPLSSP